MSNLEQFYSRHAPSLLVYARALCRPDEAAALDLVQETFLAWLAGPAERGVEDEAAYLFRTLRNRWLNELRGRTRHRARLAILAVDRPAAFDPDPASGLQSAELEAALADLPDEQREVVVMKIWGRLTFEQIGAAMDTPMKTAASRYAYGLVTLRKKLEGRP